MNKYQKYSSTYNYTFLDFFDKYNTKDEFTILQVGCNIALNLKEIKNRYPKSTIYGIDILPQAIVSAKLNNPDGYFYVCDITTKFSLFPQETFDYILFPDVLQHLTQPKEVLEYFKQFLKPDGKVLISVPNIMNWMVLYNLIYCGRFVYQETGILDYDHKHFFTNRDLQIMIRDAGFKLQGLTSIRLNNIPQDYVQFFNHMVQVSKGAVPLEEYQAFSFYAIASKV